MKGIEIPFGAKDSELCGWEYTIPEGMEAVVKDGKVIVRRKESEDERIRKELVKFIKSNSATPLALYSEFTPEQYIAYLEKQKENPKCADSVSLDCESNAKCEDRWHKVEDSLPDNGREVLAKDKLGNTLLARYDSEGWDVSVYDNKDYRCHIGISKWCDIPSEKWKEQKPAEWSEEDEGMINCIISTLCEESHGGRETNDKMVTWLEKKFKFLRPQSKPTEDELNKKYWEGYKDAMEQHNRNVSFHQDYPTSPSIPRSCYEGGPCTNPHYDCVNCPRQGGGGTYITTPNTVTSDDSNNLEAHWKPSEEQIKALYTAAREAPIIKENGNYLYDLYNDLQKLL